MRKSLLVVAMLLASVTAHAGGTRGLSTPDVSQGVKPFKQAEVTVLPAPAEGQLVAEPAVESQKPAEQPVVEQVKLDAKEAQKAASTPPPINTASTKPLESKPAAAGKAERRAQAKPRKKRMTTEARIRYELGRYGITW